MIKSQTRAFKEHIKLIIHCNNNDEAVKYLEIHIFEEGALSEEKAKDVYVDLAKSLFKITNEDEDDVDEYTISSFTKYSWETHNDSAGQRRFKYVIENLMKKFFIERPENWMYHGNEPKRKWDSSKHQDISNHEWVFECWCTELPDVNELRDEVVKAFAKYSVDNEVSITVKQKSGRNTGTGTPGEDYLLQDPMGNIPEPGDAVYLADSGKDIFVGFNKSSWKCLRSYGYGIVTKKHPVNNNGGKPFAEMEAFSV